MPNLSDTNFIRYWAFGIPKLSDSKPIRYRTYQIPKLTALSWSFCLSSEAGRWWRTKGWTSVAPECATVGGHLRLWGGRRLGCSNFTTGHPGVGGHLRLGVVRVGWGVLSPILPQGGKDRLAANYKTDRGKGRLGLNSSGAWAYCRSSQYVEGEGGTEVEYFRPSAIKRRTRRFHWFSKDMCTWIHGQVYMVHSKCGLIQPHLYLDTWPVTQQCSTTALFWLSDLNDSWLSYVNNTNKFWLSCISNSAEFGLVVSRILLSFDLMASMTQLSQDSALIWQFEIQISGKFFTICGNI